MSFFIPTGATGNGLSLATFGRSGELMGFFYPRIDFAQNVREGMWGVRFPHRPEHEAFLWCFEPCWRVSQAFEPASNVLVTSLTHSDLELSIEITDVLPTGEHGLLRRIVLHKGEHIGPVQFVHYFRLSVGDVAERNGVLVLSHANAVVQHFRDIAIAVSASKPLAASCHSLQGGGESPTKVAMRRGHFSTHGQAIGRTDFCVAFEPVSGADWEATLAVTGGSSRAAAIETAQRVLALAFADVLRTARARSSQELDAAGPCTVTDLTDAFERAVISLHDLFDATTGTFVAAPEFDPGFELSGGYGYCWPRDAAVCALTMQRIGYPNLARRFFEWTARTQLPTGHWYQRYWTDGSEGPSWCVHDGEIQLDQTCALLHAAGQFARNLGGAARGFIESYRPTAERATRAILEHIDPSTSLHRKATDLWENSLGAFPYTQAAVIAALREAEEVFAIEPERTGAAVRARLRERLIATFWQPDSQRWLRRITPEGHPDGTLDSSAMGIIDPWEVLDLRQPEDRMLAAQTLDGISRDLRSQVKGGGAVLRCQGDSYMGGGPGCVNTLWLAVCRLRLAATTTDQQERSRQRALAMENLQIALANTSPTGQLPELIPKILFEYWAAPHAWACALLIEAVMALRALDQRELTPFDVERLRVRRRAPSH
ncbi:MAG: hypothetical protein GXW89_05275 [Phycisphaerae bacterium]|nr:hypothetical protein [Phycisphaerae bacterium]